jgi:hypothetical protein
MKNLNFTNSCTINMNWNIYTPSTVLLLKSISYVCQNRETRLNFGLLSKYLVWHFKKQSKKTHARRMAFLKNGSLLFAGRAVHLSIFKHGKTVAFCKHEQFLFLWWIVYLARRAELVDVLIYRRWNIYIHICD